MSLEKRSFLSGLLYVSLAVFGPIGFLILPEQFNVSNISDFVSENTMLLVAWVSVDIIIIIIEIVLTWYLLVLFNQYNKKISLTAFVLRMIMVGVMVVNAAMLFVLLVSSNADAANYINFHSDGVYVWQLFFSVHVFLLGYMVYKYNPLRWKYLGIALILGAFGYLIDSIVNLGNLDLAVLNTLSTLLLVFVTIGEIGMAVGLILKKIIVE